MEKKTNDMIIIAATVLMILMGIVMWFQNKTLNEYKQLLEKTDTTTIVETDTIYRDKYVTDTVPKYVNQLIVKTDTVYKQVGDSIEAQPMIIALKKKKSPTLWQIQQIQ